MQKNLFCFLILFGLAAVLIAGCTSSTGPATDSGSQVQSQMLSGTIVGTWKATEGTNDFRIQFNNDSSLFYTNNGGADIVSGTWIQKGTLDNGDIAYTVTKSGTIETYVLSKSKNGIYSTSYPSLIFTAYSGGMGLTTIAPTSTSPIPTATAVATATLATLSRSDPIIGTYTCDAGSAGYGQVTFYADGSFMEYFNLVGESPAQVTGTWKYNNGVYITTLTNGVTNVWVITPNDGVKDEDGLVYLRGATPTILQATVTQSGSGSKVTTFTGSGDDVQSFTTYGSGIRIFSMRYTGSSNFIVWLENSDGDKLDLLANEIGSYSGKTSEKMGPGKYYLDVQASGPWTITLTSV